MSNSMPQRYQLEHLRAAPAVERYARPLLDPAWPQVADRIEQFAARWQS